MKRPMSLVSFILSTAMLGIYTGVYIAGSYVIFAMLGDLMADPEGIMMAGMILGQMAIFVLAVIFNAISIAKVLKKPSEFKKGAIITAIVFNFIVFLTTIMTMDTLSIITGLVAAVASILVIVDLTKEGKRKAQETAAIEEK